MAPARRPGLPVLGARLRMPAALPWRRGPAANWRCFGLNPDAPPRPAPPRRPGVAKNPAARVTAAWAGGRKGPPDAWSTKKAPVAGTTLGKSCPLAPQCKLGASAASAPRTSPRSPCCAVSRPSAARGTRAWAQPSSVQLYHDHDLPARAARPSFQVEWATLRCQNHSRHLSVPPLEVGASPQSPPHLMKCPQLSPACQGATQTCWPCQGWF
nr:putative uncharacterized protein BRD3OS isoform X1 [Desmodus rotundus]